MNFFINKILIFIPVISIFIVLIKMYYKLSFNLIFNKKTNLNLFVLKLVQYPRSNFVGKTFLNEALILICILGSFWSFYLYAHNGLFVNEVTNVAKWSINGVFMYLFFQRILISHFLSYLIFLKIFKSWGAYRFGFIFYCLIDSLLFLLGYHYLDLPFAKAYIFFWYSPTSDAIFNISMQNVNFFLNLYYFSIAFFISIFIYLVIYGIYDKFFRNINYNNFLSSFKQYNFENLIKESFNSGLDYFLVKNNILFEIIVYFYVWAFLFGRIAEAGIGVFHGPYFVLKILILIAKILTLNFYLPLFLIWSFLFNVIYFWLAGFDDLNKINLFLNYIYNYYRGAEDSIPRRIRLQNALYIFIAIAAPILMIFDISVISFFIQIYLLLVEDIQFWTTLFILFFFLYIVILALTPSNEPDHEQSNGRLFCVWIFNLSILISLFFVNSTVLYVINSNDHSIGRKIYTGDTIFTSFSVAIDTVWFNVIGENFSKFLPAFSSGIFTFGYDYFAIILCTATALIFSLIFLTSLFFANLNRKRYFFTNLLVIEICVLFAFLNLNLLGFFVFFESSLVPMFLIIGLWGSSDKRWFAAKQMLFYSLTSSTPMIICMVHFYSVYGSLDYAFLYSMTPFMSQNEKWFFWISLFLMFATKIPMFPFHSWLLNAHVEAPTGGSIILAAILLKLGIFGMVRYLFQFFNEISIQASPVVISLALIGIFYSSVCAVTELDSKRLIAHTSIAHMNLSVLGLFIFDERGLMGAIYLSIGHVVTSAALFFLIGTLYDRFHTRNLLVFGGLVQIMPIFSVFLFFFVMANSGFPWTLSFVGEFLVLAGAARKLSLLVYLILIISSVCLLYANLRLFMFICFGTINKNLIHNSVSDLTFLEVYCLILLTLNGFILMWNSSLFFAALFSDNLVRIIF